MPTIAQVEHDKAILRLIFAAAGIPDIDVEARRLEKHDLFSNEDAWADTVARKGPDEIIRAADFYEGEKATGLAKNYLYLVPTRTLLTDEWDRFLPAMAAAWREKSLNFSSATKITHEDGYCESVPDRSEGGEERQRALIFMCEVKQRLQP